MWDAHCHLPNQDRYEVSLDLVAKAGTEKTMQANLTQYEDVAKLKDDILCFLSATG